jgi:hypothetical protein
MLFPPLLSPSGRPADFFTGMRKWRHFSAIRGRRRVRFESSQCAMGEKVARPEGFEPPAA